MLVKQIRFTFFYQQNTLEKPNKNGFDIYLEGNVARKSIKIE